MLVVRDRDAHIFGNCWPPYLAYSESSRPMRKTASKRSGSQILSVSDSIQDCLVTIPELLLDLSLSLPNHSVFPPLPSHAVRPLPIRSLSFCLQPLNLFPSHHSNPLQFSSSDIAESSTHENPLSSGPQL